MAALRRQRDSVPEAASAGGKSSGSYHRSSSGHGEGLSPRGAISKGVRAGGALAEAQAAAGGGARRRSSSLVGGASASLSPRNAARMFGQLVDVAEMSEADLEKLIAEKAGGERFSKDSPEVSRRRSGSGSHRASPNGASSSSSSALAAPSPLATRAASSPAGVRPDKACEHCRTRKATSRVMLKNDDGGGASKVKLCAECLARARRGETASERRSTEPEPSAGATRIDEAASKERHEMRRRDSVGMMPMAERKTGMLAMGQRRTEYYVVLEAATLSWYESKKSLEASNEVNLGGAVVDSFGKVIFVQSGDAVYDFEAKSQSDFDAWYAALETAQRWASSVEQKLPLARYQARSVFPVRVLLPLPKGTVRIVCNTKHTGTRWQTARARASLSRCSQARSRGSEEAALCGGRGARAARRQRATKLARLLLFAVRRL